MLKISDALPGYPIAVRIPFYFLRVDRIDPCGVQPEDLGAKLRCDFRIPIPLPQFPGYLEGAERLDLVLGGAVPYRVCTPEYIILTAILQEFT
jgi:hypothetical protein